MSRPYQPGRKTIDIVPASYCRLFDSVPISTEAISSANRANRIVIGKELNLDLPILKCGINGGPKYFATGVHFISRFFIKYLSDDPPIPLLLLFPATSRERCFRKKKKEKTLLNGFYGNLQASVLIFIVLVNFYTVFHRFENYLYREKFIFYLLKGNVG